MVFYKNEILKQNYMLITSVLNHVTKIVLVPLQLYKQRHVYSSSCVPWILFVIIIIIIIIQEF